MVDTSQWAEPLLFGSQPLYQDGVLYVFDRADHTLKAYRTPPNGAQAQHLWTTSGKGRGPGEFPKTSKFLCVTRNPEDGSIWLSHQWGHLIFDRDGQFDHHLERQKGGAWAVPIGNHLLLSAGHPLKDKTLVSHFRKGQSEPTWEWDNPVALQVGKDNRIVMRRPELHAWGREFVAWDTANGLLTRGNLQGQQRWQKRLRQTFPPSWLPDTTEDREAQRPKANQPVTMRVLTYGLSGFSAYGDHITVQTLHYCEGVRLTDDEVYFERRDDGSVPVARFITEVDAATGEQTAWYYHPRLTGEWYLFHEDDQHWYLFDEADGATILSVVKAEAKIIRFPLN